MAQDAVVWDDSVPKTSFFDHPFFRNKPALAALKDVQDPKPEHIRACLLEMARHIIKAEEKEK
jgi:hypothetical protein